MQQAQIL